VQIQQPPPERDAPPGVSLRKLNLANRLTVSRLLFVPAVAILFIYYTPERDYLRYVTLVAFGMAGLTDALDGLIARAWGQRTRLGSFIDPIADKLLINVAFIFLAVHGSLPVRIPAWAVVVILARDVFIVMGAWYLHEFHGPLVVKPRLLGKITTTFQMITVLWALLAWPFIIPLWQTTVLLTVLSLIDYARMASLRASPNLRQVPSVKDEKKSTKKVA